MQKTVQTKGTIRIFLSIIFALLFLSCEDKKIQEKIHQYDTFTYTIFTPDSHPHDDRQSQDSTKSQERNLQTPHTNQILKIEVLDIINEKLNVIQGQSIFTQTKPSMLFFIQQDCRNCLMIAPHMMRLAQKYKKNINFYILTTSSQTKEQLDTITDNLKYYGDFHLYVPTESLDLVVFLDKDISRGYIMLLDSNGDKVIDYIGLVPEEMLELDIKNILDTNSKG